jgi:hypothetical protein
MHLADFCKLCVYTLQYKDSPVNFMHSQSSLRLSPLPHSGFQPFQNSIHIVKGTYSLLALYAVNDTHRGAKKTVQGMLEIINTRYKAIICLAA